jgi:hypothetical protein
MQIPNSSSFGIKESYLPAALILSYPISLDMKTLVPMITHVPDLTVQFQEGEKYISYIFSKHSSV